MCSVQDWKEQCVSNIKIFTGIIFVFICNFWSHNWLEYMIGGVLVFVIYLVTKLIMKSRMGWGDVFYAFFTGLCLCPYFAIISIFISVISGAAFILIVKRKSKGHGIFIPFIPFMSAGLVVSYFLMILFRIWQINFP